LARVGYSLGHLGRHPTAPENWQCPFDQLLGHFIPRIPGRTYVPEKLELRPALRALFEMGGVLRVRTMQVVCEVVGIDVEHG